MHRGPSHVDIGATDAFRGQLRIAPGVLAAVRRRDEGAIAVLAGEDDVARLIADEQRAHHAGAAAVQTDDADAVGQVVYDPHFFIGAHGNGDRLQAHGDGGAVNQGAIGIVYVINFQLIIGSVSSKQSALIRRQRDGSYLAALKESITRPAFAHLRQRGRDRVAIRYGSRTVAGSSETQSKK